VKVVTTGLGRVSDFKMDRRAIGVVTLLLLISCIALSIGSPAIDYPNDYYNDAEYYNDAYGSYNSSDENYIDVDAQVKETVVRRNPKFISTSKTIIVNEGDTIKLPCQVDILGDFVIIWKKGSTILALGDNVMSSDSRVKVSPMKNGNRLVISLADYKMDDGRYTCQLSAQRSVELEHTVRVRVQPEVESVPAGGSLVVQAGAPVTLKCKVLRGSPTPEMTWHRAQRAMPGGESEVKADQLTFPKTSRHHSGVYTCSADNGWGSAAQARIVLDVQHKPEIEQEETFIHTKDGDDVEITCTVHASPPADVSWYRNGGLLPADKTVVQTRGNRHSLLLQQVGSVDLHGKYQCRAKNPLGEAMALTEVSGKPAPANFKSPKMGSELESYTLEWVVTSSSPVTKFRVEWKIVGKGKQWQSEIAEVKQVGAESYAGEVALEGLVPGREYMARVAATNSYGESRPGEGFQFSTMSKSVSSASTSSSSCPAPLFHLLLLPFASLLILKIHH